MEPLTHKVQAGDTVSGIAKRFGVRKEDVQGFRSNDPNVIFPDEILTINKPVTQEGAPVATPATPDLNAVPPRKSSFDP